MTGRFKPPGAAGGAGEAGGRYRLPIRRKLFLLLVVVLAVHIVVLVFMGSTLFERFYRGNKVNELKSAARQIREAYERADSDALYEAIELVENRNTLVALLRWQAGDALPEMEYFTRDRLRAQWEAQRQARGEEAPATAGGGERAGQDGQGEEGAPTAGAGGQGGWDPQEAWPAGQEGGWEAGHKVRWDRLPDPPPPIFDDAVVRELPGLGESTVVRDTGGVEGGHLYLLTALGEGLYLYIGTPQDYIKSTADQAVRYTSLLSVCILAAGAVLIYYLAGRVTRPIRAIQNVADKIARMDFSESCPVRSKDELGALSESINHMSEALQQNIEKLVAANEVLQSDLQRQQETDRMRRQFVANVSHDFKTPLTLIISYAEALGDTGSPAQREEYRAIILDEGNKLSRMVGQLLRLSQLECGTSKLQAAPFCLSDLVEPVLQAHRIVAQKKGLALKGELPADLVVLADYQKVGQVVTNLVDNAVKYAARGGQVRVCAGRVGEECEVSVYNDGPPIETKAMARLFDSFYRADASRHRDAQSYGLGLAIVRAILELHGKAYGCENVPGGVRFWFRLALLELGE